MFDSIHLVGEGRAGTVLAARLRERGQRVTVGRHPQETSELVILAVPDRVIGEVAGGIQPGAWICHISGATRLTALDPHVRRFSLHPLQTLTTARGAQQLDGAWCAISGEADDAMDRARWLANALGLRPFELADEDRTLYHVAAVIGGNYLVTLHQVASRLLVRAGAPPEAIVPLMSRTIENGFDLTGPIARGDWSTVNAHIEALQDRAPDLVPLYRALAEATRR